MSSLSFSVTNGDCGNLTNFVTLIKNLEHITTDIELVLSEEGLHSEGLDQTHCLYYCINLDKDWFSTYNVVEEVKLGINTTIISKIFGCIKSTTQKIEFSSENLDKLNIRFVNHEDGNVGSNLKSSNYEFEMPLMTLNVENMEIPKMDYDIDIKMNSQEIRDLHEEISGFGENVKVTINESKIEYSTEGVNGKCKIIVKDQHIDELSMLEDMDTFQQKYSIDKLRKIFKFHKLSKLVNVHFMDEIPMKILLNMDTKTKPAVVDKKEDVVDEDTDDEDSSDEDSDDDDEEDKAVENDEEEEKPVINFMSFYLAPKID